MDGGGPELSTGGAGASEPGGAEVVRRPALLLRSKGLVWLASRSDQVGDWSQAGTDVHFDYGGRWFVEKK